MIQLETKLKHSCKAKPLLSQWQLLQIFNYDNHTGLLYYINKQTNIFRPVGNINKQTGRAEVQINKQKYQQSRIIYKMYTGEEPPIVDHIDGNPSNNKLENLRPSNHLQNQHNRKISADNKTGHKNICWHKGAKKWYVQVRYNNKFVVRLLIEDLELAILVAQEARDKYHGQFARHQ
jgi:hypothetical protein